MGERLGGENYLANGGVVVGDRAPVVGVFSISLLTARADPKKTHTAVAKG